MPTRLPDLLRDSPFRVADARALGVGEGRLRSRDLVAPHHGVRALDDPRSVRERCWSLLPVLPSAVAFSHITAAELWGLPLPLGRRGGDLHVVSASGAHPRRPGVVGHRAKAVRGTFLGGVPVVEPTVAWAQCAALLDVDDLVAMGDALAGRWSPHPAAREVGLKTLEAAVDDWGSRRGARQLRAALPWMRANVWSPRETAVRLVLVRGGIPEPDGLNAPITDARGTVLGHGDLVWREQRLVVEYEGDQHRTDRRQWRIDLAKYESYADAGWRVVRATDDDLVSPGILRARVSRLLAAGALQ